MDKRDFSADIRLIWISLLAMPIGIVCALLALVLQRLIGFFTNLFYFQKLAIPSELVSPLHGASGAGLAGGSRSGRRRADNRTHGSVRLGSHPGPRYT